VKHTVRETSPAKGFHFVFLLYKVHDVKNELTCYFLFFWFYWIRALSFYEKFCA